ncbi:heme-binding HmuY-like protein [Dyadobacter jejuensis]|uniref:Heme-binding HmuY-like protein n=1 Tax=Dyadobacter jejuensis TaxID=1082580 RepID=A0A316AHE1_9BACT|nr:HmuY family protein [Dyadobacter jejuensis]PWJ56698.1 heme-binding HmuY-like protein [Dyadobacter jejuensis]
MISQSIILNLLGLSLLGAPLPSDNPQNVAAEEKLIRDLDARQGSFTYFDLDKGEIVADSSENHWDIAFSKTRIVLNGGIHGSGSVQGQVLPTSFEALRQVPTDGFKSDTDTSAAIPYGSGNGWYTYDMRFHAIVALPDRSIIVKTTEGRYVKIQIKSYYKGAPEDIPSEESSFYTFRYSSADAEGHF